MRKCETIGREWSKWTSNEPRREDRKRFDDHLQGSRKMGFLRSFNPISSMFWPASLNILPRPKKRREKILCPPKPEEGRLMVLKNLGEGWKTKDGSRQKEDGGR